MEKYRIAEAPSSIYYIADFLTPDEEASLLDKIPSNRWVTLSHRRLQALPARLTATNTLLTAATLPVWLTQPVLERVHALGVFADSPHGGANHCLINEYLPGQGIMAHEDGPAYHSVVATVSLGGTVVLEVREKGGDDEYAEDNDNDLNGANDNVTAQTGRTVTGKAWRILQEPRSLLVTTGAAYERTLHGIRDTAVDNDLSAATVANWNLLGDRERLVASAGKNERVKRVSLTFRDVKKVSSVGARIFGRPRG